VRLFIRLLLKIMPHAAVQIYIWAVLTVVLQMLHADSLFILAAGVILLSVVVCPQRFFFMLRRTRWILISVLFIYAYAAQGEMLWPQLGMFSPSASGMQEGLAQIARLAGILASLAVILTWLTQEQLLGGLYTLLYPLSLFGFPRKLVALRLALTLHYAQQAVADTSVNWRERLEQMNKPEAVAPVELELRMDVLSRTDWVLILLASAGLAGMWL
jgi:energy-coupling factor transport system permease protein